jgi:flagellar secretion chaperone FliS
MYRPASARALNAYRNIGVETSVATMDQHQIVALLYEGFLQAVNEARGALARRDILTKCNAINRALRILTEGLGTALDRQDGGELARNLSALYDYCMYRLAEANAKNDDAMLQEIYGLIEPIALSWKSIRGQVTPGGAS